MTLQQIYYLIQIADTGSINRAAEKLFLSQPALTNAVKEIETELGFQVLNRRHASSMSNTIFFWTTTVRNAAFASALEFPPSTTPLLSRHLPT